MENHRSRDIKAERPRHQGRDIKAETSRPKHQGRDIKAETSRPRHQGRDIKTTKAENLDHITDLEETATIACLRAKISSLEKKLEETKIHTTIVQQGRRRINKQVRQTIATNQDHKCNDCKTTLTAYFQIDHLIGLQYGGTDEIDNLQALCGDCHTKKSNVVL